jgi:hypothetical protein
MDTIKIIERLAKTAQKEKPPQIDVSKAVMLEIGILQQETAGFLPFEWFAGISAVAASIVMFLSFYAWRYMADPFVQLFAPFQEILPW